MSDQGSSIILAATSPVERREDAERRLPGDPDVWVFVVPS